MAMILVGILLLVFAIFFGTSTMIEQRVKLLAQEKARSDLATLYEIIHRELPGEWRVEGGNLYKGTVLLNDNNALVDWLGKLTGNTVTIFLGSTRIATNVLVDGKRAVGTEVSLPIQEAVLKNRQEFFGEANVAGHLYQTAYRPILGEGKVLGIFYTGASQELIDSLLRSYRGGLIGISFGLSVLLMLLLSYALRSLVTKPLGEIANHARTLGTGDLSQTVCPKLLTRGDEIGIVAQSCKQLIETLRDTVKQLRQAIHTTAQTAQTLSAASQENSATIEEVASSVNTFGHSVSDVKQQTQTMKKGADTIGVLASEGAKQMQVSKSSMTNIVDSSNQAKQAVEQIELKAADMEKILRLISAVADQTNLLALNAAIEAARAGEHGRGFAVVADEVRQLAEQTQSSVSQITSMIGALTENVRSSAKIMKETESHVTEGSSALEKTQKDFLSITERIGQTTTAIQEVYHFH